MLRKFLTKKKLFFFSAVTATALYEYSTTQRNITRTLNTIRCGLWILYNYKIRFNAENCMEIHQFTARDIYQTCHYNDGLYVKLGQGIAASDHVLPPPFFKWMSKLQDKAKQTSFEDVQKIFREQQGKQLSQCFLQFEKFPVASASIAQVHKAKLLTGEDVAVKIQKPNIKGQFHVDMAMHTIILQVLQFAFNLPLVQFAEPIQKNLERQVDFNIEAQNSIIAAEKFKSINRDDIYVPKVYKEFTRNRVMVTEWIDGIKITDEKKLQEWKFNKQKIIQNIISAFAEQIFITGFVHCDPHPGNVFIRKNPKNGNEPQIVILDHGLCIGISQNFRRQYSGFWKAMFLQDKNKMSEICNEWGLKFKDTFASSQLLRPYSSDKHVNEKITSDDVLKSQLKMKQQIKEIMVSSGGYPQQLIFIARNMNLIRSLNKYYGSKVDRVSIMAQSAVRGLITKDSSKRQNRIKEIYQQFKFKIFLFYLRIYNFYLRYQGSSIQEFVNEKEREKINERFVAYGFKPTDQKSFDA